MALLLLGFVLAGTGIGFAETAESTLVAQLLPGRLRANGFGVLGITQAAGDLASSDHAPRTVCLSVPRTPPPSSPATRFPSSYSAGAVR